MGNPGPSSGAGKRSADGREIGQDAKLEGVKNRIGQPANKMVDKKEAKALNIATFTWKPGPPGEKCALGAGPRAPAAAPAIAARSHPADPQPPAAALAAAGGWGSAGWKRAAVSGAAASAHGPAPSRPRQARRSRAAREVRQQAAPEFHADTPASSGPP